MQGYLAPLRCIVVALTLPCLATLNLRGDEPADNQVAETDRPIYLAKTDPDRASILRSRSWIETIAEEIPPLEHDNHDHMPMVMWYGVGFDPLSTEQIEILRKRGLCQHLQLNEAMIPAAKALADAGMPIILLEGRTDSWPYSLADELEGMPGDWAHQFDLTYIPPWFGKDDPSQWHGACPHRTEGWTVLEKQTKSIMMKFKDAGIRVDAVLVDYEGDPYPWAHLFEQLRHCRRCRSELPVEIIQNRSAWRDYSWKQFVSLYDEHFARPIREVYPDALVTNWHVVHSSEEVPVRYFASDVNLPVLQPRYFSATNPIAYASDLVWRARWNPSDPLTQTAVDNFYEHEIVQQVQADRRNRESRDLLSTRSLPWVARVCRITGDTGEPVPIMSRERYRKSLAELWDLDVHALQIFNPMHEGYEELALTEVQDAVAAYDKMLAETDGDGETQP